MNTAKRLLTVFCAAFAIQAHAAIEYVIAISVDGLRADYLQEFMTGSPAEFPNWNRLRDAGASTFNARCDYDYSESVPNHVAMLTGRPVLQPGGFPANGFTGFTNNTPGASDTIHVYGAPGTNSGPYKASIFDMAHDRVLSTALYLGKTRLDLCERSFNATNGAPDTVGADNGRDKIDFFQTQNALPSTALTTTLTAHIAGPLEKLTFLHITDPDTAGHAPGGGWNTTVGGQYRNSIKAVDSYIGAILNAVEANPALAGKVAIILTADHGGGGSSQGSHAEATVAGNYTIPFFLVAPGVPAGSDIYSLFQNRFNPGTTRPTFLSVAQPLHNADIANLATALLGLPVVTGSMLIPEFKKNVIVANPSPGIYTVSWPLYLTGWALESCDDLGASTPVWTPVSTGIVENGATFTHTVPDPAPAKRLFRLRRPS